MTGDEVLILAMRLQGRVNAQAFRDKPPGTVLVQNVEHTTGGPLEVFLIEKPDGWGNAVVNGRPVPIVDSKGRPLFDPVGFLTSDDIVYHCPWEADAPAIVEAPSV